MKKWFDTQMEAHQSTHIKIRALRDVEKLDWEKYMKDVAKLQEQNADLEVRNNDKRLEANVVYHAAALKNEKSFWKDREELYLEGMAEEQAKNLEIWGMEKAALEQRASIIKDAIFMQKEYEEVRQKILVLEGKITEEELKNFHTNEALMEKKLAKAKEYFNLAIEFVQQMAAADLESYSNAWESATEAVLLLRGMKCILLHCGVCCSQEVSKFGTPQAPPLVRMNQNCTGGVINMSVGERTVSRISGHSTAVKMEHRRRVI